MARSRYIPTGGQLAKSRGGREPTLQEWQDALNRQMQEVDKGITEVDAKIMQLEENVVAQNFQNRASFDSIRSTQRGKKGYAIRIGIADAATIERLVAVSEFNIRVSIIEGFRGVDFPSPIGTIKPVTILGSNVFHQVPVKGRTFFSRADTVYVIVGNFGTTPGELRSLSTAIIPCDENLPENQPDILEENEGGEVPFPEFCYEFEVDVNGGVQAGDAVEILNYAGALIRSYPWGEGLRKAVPLAGQRVRYNPAGAAVAATFRFYIQK